MKLVKEHLLDCADYLETPTPEEAYSVSDYFVNITGEGNRICWPAAYLFLRDMGIGKDLEGSEEYLSERGLKYGQSPAFHFVALLEENIEYSYYNLLEGRHLELALMIRDFANNM